MAECARRRSTGPSADGSRLGHCAALAPKYDQLLSWIRLLLSTFHRSTPNFHGGFYFRSRALPARQSGLHELPALTRRLRAGAAREGILGNDLAARCRSRSVIMVHPPNVTLKHRFSFVIHTCIDEKHLHNARFSWRCSGWATSGPACKLTMQWISSVICRIPASKLHPFPNSPLAPSQPQSPWCPSCS